MAKRGNTPKFMKETFDMTLTPPLSRRKKKINSNTFVISGEKIYEN